MSQAIALAVSLKKPWYVNTKYELTDFVLRTYVVCAKRGANVTIQNSDEWNA